MECRSTNNKTIECHLSDTCAHEDDIWLHCSDSEGKITLNRYIQQIEINMIY
jgi:hypothetical protein